MNLEQTKKIAEIRERIGQLNKELRSIYELDRENIIKKVIEMGLYNLEWVLTTHGGGGLGCKLESKSFQPLTDKIVYFLQSGYHYSPLELEKNMRLEAKTDSCNSKYLYLTLYGDVKSLVLKHNLKINTSVIDYEIDRLQIIKRNFE